MPHLLVRQLSKRFGSLRAVVDASLAVGAGEVVGLLGPNGAGKSTLFECIAGLLPADGGSVVVDDREITPARRRQTLLFLPDGIVPWPEQSPRWILDFAAHAFSATVDWRAELAPALHLDETWGRPMGALSKGQRKRVLLALALLSGRPILLMDEPFDGLDLRQTREAIGLFRRVAGAGRSLLLSLHSMSDAARVCDRLVLLSGGHVLADGSLDELRARAGLPGADLEDVFLALA
jgi:ABC-type multidrug transport system ATPase subunit